MRLFLIFLSFSWMAVIYLLVLPSPSFAQDKIMLEGRIKALETIKVWVDDTGQTNSSLKAEVEVKRDQTPYFLTAFINQTGQTENHVNYRVGQKVRLEQISDPEGNLSYFITSPVRRTGLYLLFGIFSVLVLITGRKYGLFSLVGLGLSFLVIMKLVIPMIMAGSNPLMVAVLGCLIIIPATFYVSHGISLKTHVGAVSTLIALILTGLLANIFTKLTYISGLANEEASFLMIERSSQIDIRAILLAGIILGTLGILDDITVGQSSVVQQLKLANPKLGVRQLFTQAMKVGHDHIAATVNTLVLVYAGVALPLLLLYYGENTGFVDFLEFELIAEEVVRMLVGSIALVSIAPVATFLAAVAFVKFPPTNRDKDRNHQH